MTAPQSKKPKRKITPLIDLVKARMIMAKPSAPVMTRARRLQLIRRAVHYRDYLTSLPDPASLARAPTREEREQLVRASDLAGTRAGASWVARQRGIR